MISILDSRMTRMQPGKNASLEIKNLTTQNEFNDYITQVKSPRLDLEKKFSAFGRGKKQWAVPGFCEVCEKQTLFYMDWNFSDQQTPNYRERLVCPSCLLNNRQRWVMTYLKCALKVLAPTPAVYLFEQTTPFYRWAASRLSNTALIGSEYLGFAAQPGSLINGIRHEDAMNLSFADASLDVIVSNDVLEHVPVYERALEESARVLREKGKLIFSIPFYTNRDETSPRARLEHNAVKLLLPAEYHGPCLVFHDFGWDLLPACRRAGFRQAQMLLYYSPGFGYLGNGCQFIFIAEK
ncbi:MAG: class I SAM-dependent methyltransferase [Candidatus Firestonebacteria bacterium]|nr:class I SAM-dependent methyltransferase [Candidatus Firestonebacteria bacterium]